MRELSLMYLLNLAWRRIWALAAAFILLGGIAFCYCEFAATPVYSAKASVLVTNGGSITNTDIENVNSVTNNDITASVNMIETVVDILKTPDIYKQLASKLNNRYTYQQLMGKCSVVSRSEDTMFIDVSFSATTPDEAKRLVNAFVELAPEYIADPIPYSHSKYYTTESAAKTYPVTSQLTIIFGLVGVVITYGVVLLIDSFDRAIKGEEDFVSRFDIPLLGTVPDFETATSGNKSSYKGYKKYRSYKSYKSYKGENEQ